MTPQQNRRDNKHQRPVQTQQIRFMRHQHTVIPHAKFNHPEQRADHHQHAANIQRKDQLSPGPGDRVRARGGVLVHAEVEVDGGDDEETEEDDLNGQAAEDD
jgi:hypothetical protein